MATGSMISCYARITRLSRSPQTPLSTAVRETASLRIPRRSPPKILGAYSSSRPLSGKDQTFCSSTTTAGRSSRLTQRSSTAGSMASRRNGARMCSATVPAAGGMLSTSWRTPRPASRWLISRACTVVGRTVHVLRSPTSTATGPVFEVWCPGLLNGDSTPRKCRGQATWE